MDSSPPHRGSGFFSFSHFYTQRNAYIDQSSGSLVALLAVLGWTADEGCQDKL